MFQECRCQTQLTLCGDQLAVAAQLANPRKINVCLCLAVSITAVLGVESITDAEDPDVCVLSGKFLRYQIVSSRDEKLFYPG